MAKNRHPSVAARSDEATSGYDPHAFPPVAVTVDVVVLTIRNGALDVLLVERGEEPYSGCWALPGGFVRPDEDLASAAIREAGEETGLALPPRHLEQLRTYGDPDRDPRMRVFSVAYVAMMPDLPTPSAGTDASDAAWWVAEDLGGVDGPELAFDHQQILDDALERLRSKLEYTNLATAFVGETFTLSQLRRVYEAVWDTKLEPGNFRRKVLSTPAFVEALHQTASPGVGRPAQLYRSGPAVRLHPAMLRGEQAHTKGERN